MEMVRTRESSQCRAVAVPCAWKARLRGCDFDSCGGSVVLQCPDQRWHRATDARGTVHTLAVGIGGTKSFGAVLPFFQGMPRTGRVQGRSFSLEVCDALDVGGGLVKRGVR